MNENRRSYYAPLQRDAVKSVLAMKKSSNELITINLKDMIVSFAFVYATG